ncbi:MAG TPA: sugar ABC transporter substrate-binding protein [Limnochordales bacterium]
MKRLTRRLGRWAGAGMAALAAALALVGSAWAAPVTIRYAFWGNPTALGVEKDIIDAFEAQHPDIHVEPVVMPISDYRQGLLTLIAGGQAPDVMRIDSLYLYEFVQRGALLDVTDLIRRDEIPLERYYQVGLDEVKVNGRYYGLPWGTAPYYLFVNTQVFKEAGLALPDWGWKWEDFVAAAKRVSGGTGLNRRYGYGMQYLFPEWLSFVWSNGGDVFDPSGTRFTLNQPAAVQRIQEVADLVKQGVITPPGQFPNPDAVTRWMVSNRLAMHLSGAGGILQLQEFPDFQFEAMPYPTGVQERSTVVKSNAISISATSKNVEAAWTFVKFLRAPGMPGEEMYVRARRVPPSVDDPNLWRLYADPTKPPRRIAEVTQAIAQRYGRRMPLRPGWGDIDSLLSPELQAVALGEKTAKQALDALAARAQQILDTSR